MTMDIFLLLLFVFSSLSTLITEGVKRKFLKGNENVAYNVVALIVAMIVGGVGCAIYYQLNGMLFTLNNIIFIVLMGIASGACSMIEYDKIKQTVIQLASLKK